MKNAVLILFLLLSFSFAQADEEDGLPPKEDNSGDKTLEVPEAPPKRNYDALAISEYQQTYFITGEPDTKIQVSFQFRLFKEYALYFGYTQRMFWELFREESSPFSDVNFMPDLFYRFDTESWKYVQNIETGYLHMSNGQSEPESRTVDTIFARFIWRGKFFTSLNTKYYFNKEKANRDFTKYVGPFELQLQLKDILKILYAPQDFYARVYTGGDWGEDLGKTSVELGLRYRFFGSDSSPGIFMQYFRGYGEKILNYNILEESYRVGFSVGGDYRVEEQSEKR